MNAKPLLCVAILLLTLTAGHSQSRIWAENAKSEKANSIASLKEGKYKLYSLDFNSFKAQLQAVNRRGEGKSGVKVSFPNLDGKFEEYNVFEAPVLSDELSIQYPDIKTYVGFSTDKTYSRIRFSVTPQGLQTMVSYLDKPTSFLVPLRRGNNTQYIIYNRGSKDFVEKEFDCFTPDERINDLKFNQSNHRDANDQMLRTFRIAVSTTAEYTNFWDDGNNGNGNAQQDALAQIVSTLNRNNEVFEVDMAVTFNLVTGTQLIYTNSGTDPYTTSGSYNGQLQTTLTNNFGEANYDIGHLFASGFNSGNAGCIGCVCVDGSKGSGWSAHTWQDNDGGPYMNDFFDIDYVPHEIGHQMGANHTWSFQSEGTGVNAEPGSGTTIMGYAGITGANDVQDHSDPYFHYYSIQQVLDNLETRTCWQGQSSTLTNEPPVAEAGPNYTIPAGTAFVLRGSATDADAGDILTYNWEQIDNGVTTSGNFGPNKTTGAVWRSRPPSTNPDRYMPIIERVVNGQLTETNPVETVANTSWETVSNVSRSLNFALIVRDRSEANGVGQNPQSDYDTMTVTVDDNFGPFTVTSQPTNVTWDTGTIQTVTWNVAGTDGGAINTSNVNILLSIDGGFTYPYTLASNVANDGSHDISVPSIGSNSSTARVKVEAEGNIFYAINSTNFTIQQTEFDLTVSNPSIDVCAPNDAVYSFTYNTFLGFSGTTNFSANNLPTGASIVFSPTSASANGTNVTATISGTGSVATGSYNNIELVGTSGSITKTSIVSLNVFDSTFSALNLTSPSDGATGVSQSPTLVWDADANASSYDVELATDNTFTTIVSSANVTTTSYSVSGLNQTTLYYWRVKPKNNCGEGSFSSIYSFTTLSCTACPSVANTIFETSTTLVNFAGINNPSGKPSGYSDYTNLTATVVVNNSYDITVNVDTDGNFVTHTLVWIDWNQNCSFDDPGEEYDLGTAFGETNGATSDSPFSITVPSNAVLGNTIMRVTTKYNSDPTSCENNHDAEVEDYTVEVQGQTLEAGDFTFANFNLYPNPSNGIINLVFDTIDSNNVKTTLYDIRGRKVSEKVYRNVTSTFNEALSFNATAGIYLLRIENGGRQLTRKVVIR
ncbi:MAG: T9SS C-terminal target domain-containing protein [Winogradskyella sp.]|uniref:zinc-dependent metalloprotease n=1 Tax=Winogradskyella sp. TaxID=1883156 RepID=UPI000F40A19D|nr:zinc-dependent metalloprotease family protein [Winogradskyella sp.]RNC83490.1 MAG: T9SS C-terminal target domain-containing protein [Winogradskyella sp.]